MLTGGDSTAYLHKHLVNILIGLVLAAAVMATDHRWVRIVTPLVYVGSVIGLLLVLVMGTTINGSRSWLMLGGLSIQPAEFAKLAVVIGMAMIIAERTENSRQRRVGLVDVALLGVLAGIPAVLIILQPDLGTMLVLAATVFGVLAVAGVPRRWLVTLFVSGATVAFLAVSLGLLKQYQLNRFMAFTDPALDPRGAGYNTTQARIAIGNGGLFGQGLFDGSQTRSRFVPEQHTDFIFTVAGEELGLIGAGVLILLFAVAAVAGAVHLHARRRHVRPGRGGGHRLLVRLPDLPEHRDVPGHHAGDRRTPPAGVVRRVVDVRLDDGRRAAAEHRHARKHLDPDQIAGPGVASQPSASGLGQGEGERRAALRVALRRQLARRAGDDPSGEREAEARACGAALGRPAVELLEDLLLLTLGTPMPWSVTWTVTQPGSTSRAEATLHPGCPVGGRVLDGVLHEVVQQLPEQARGRPGRCGRGRG